MYMYNIVRYMLTSSVWTVPAYLFSGPDAHVRYTVQGIIVRYDGEHITTRKIITVLRDFDPRKENPDKLAIPVSEKVVHFVS